ncbi:MAG: hypothetical protein FJZ90_12955, partial [Chloroflexi bacterium]|nr:hypothetical protein [Chloroflexota bacterium]
MTTLTTPEAQPKTELFSPLALAWTLPAEDDTLGPTLTARLNSLSPTDAGEAEALAIIFGDKLRYDHTSRHWLCWDGVRWKRDEDGEPERLALETARARLAAAAMCGDADQRQRLASWALSCESSYRRKATLEAAESLRPLATTSAQYDTDPWLLACANGVVDLRTGELRPGRPSDMLTKTTGVVYEAGATCERWLRFLEEVFARDKTDEDKPDEQQELVDYIQRAVGYSLTGNTSEQCFFLCHGDGNNGKSVFLETLRSILGEYAQNTAFATFEDQGKGGRSVPNDLASLHGARLITASEVADNKRLNEARIKSLTGQDPVTARFLFSEFFTFRPAFKLWLAANHKPQIRETTRAIWRRVRLVPFLQHFEPDQEPGLLDTLKAEAPGILAWAIAGCLEWQNKRLGVAKS